MVFGTNAGPGVFISNTNDENWADLAKGCPPERVMSATDLAAFNKLNPPGLITVISRDVTTFDAEMSFSSPATTSR